MSVGVARRRVDAPAVDGVAGVDERRIPGEAHEVREHVAGLDQLLRHRRRDAVAEEPVGDPLRPVARAPHALALRVVEAPLEHGRSRRLRRRLGPADVIGMHVRDEDARDRSVDLGEDLLPRRLEQAEARIHDRPPVLAAEGEQVVDDPGRFGRPGVALADQRQQHRVDVTLGRVEAPGGRKRQAPQQAPGRLAPQLEA